MLNIVIPMAGRGSRFANKGYELPKPLIPVHGEPMIKLVIGNLRPKREHRFIFLVLQEHIEKYRIDALLKDWAGDSCKVVAVDGVTEGAACTVLLAKDFVNSTDELMIANSDQWIDFNIDEYLHFQTSQRLDGLIMTMTADDPKWSFVRLKGNFVCEVAEKKVISNEATVGIYNFAHGKDFVQAAEKMIACNERVNGEFYVAPCYNQLVQDKKNIGVFNIGSEFEGMYGIGVPDDLDRFLAHPISRKAISHD